MDSLDSIVDTLIDIRCYFISEVVVNESSVLLSNCINAAAWQYCPIHSISCDIERLV